MIGRNAAGAALAASLLVLVACGGGQSMDEDNMGMTGASLTSTAVLLSVSPAPNSSGVSTGALLTMRFNHPMAAGMEQFLDLHEGDVAGPLVSMSCGWSADRTTLTCTPSDRLGAHAHHTIHVGPGMMDRDGHPLDLGPAGPMGGQWVTSSRMGGTHAGMPWGMMGPGWHGADGSHGMAFGFTTTS